MPLLEPLYQMSEISAAFGVEHIITSPGSRSAALTLAFSRNLRLTTYTIADERSAAFVALGIAMITKKPSILICTSGTAALNFAPAVAEAYFQSIPLLILTADRPPEWINQHDGQTVYQENLFGRHVVQSYHLPVDYRHPDSSWQIERDMHEALAWTSRGPVHINVPIREPFYPKEGESYEENSRRLKYYTGKNFLSENQWTDLWAVWNSSKNILVAIGQNHERFSESLRRLLPKVEVLSDVISNVGLEEKVSFHDTFLKDEPQVPDLLITAGKSFISKSLKQYFRIHKPKSHWHIEDSLDLVDPFKSITDKITVSPIYFFEELAKKVTEKTEGQHTWSSYNSRAEAYLLEFISKCSFGELRATFSFLKSLKEDAILHLGNSMPVRYANLLGGFLNKNVSVYANRGTSGIDGIVSTAIGHALVAEKRVFCLVGDVSFFYDSNALFAAKTDNITIIVINNSGGNIFRIIDGPKSLPELETRFIANPKRTAKSLAQEAGYKYSAITTENEWALALTKKESVATLFEIFTDGVKDAEIFKNLKEGL